MTQRVRMVAGPNGSGKTTLLDRLREKCNLHRSLNPDDIEAELKQVGELHFSTWGLQVEQGPLRAFLRRHPLKLRGLQSGVVVRNNILKVDRKDLDGYLAAALCDFVRRQWLLHGESFTFETVMSHPDKVEFLHKAQRRGYRTYLYYVCTTNPLINCDRVAVRVGQGGHDVPEERIIKRYKKSLSQLLSAIRQSNRAYLFDNSEKEHLLIAEFKDGKLVWVDQDPPGWFVTHVLNKLA